MTSISTTLTFAERSADQRTWWSAQDGQQPGDPDKLLLVSSDCHANEPPGYLEAHIDPEYRDRIPPFDTPIPGLYLANMFQVYPHDRGQNYSIALAERLAKGLA